MKQVLLTLLCLLILAVAVLLAVAYGGFVDVAATTAHSDAVEWFLVTTRDRSIDARADRLEVPPLDDPRMLRTGLVHYHAMCVACHGAPGVDPAELARGLNPMPPDLYSEEESAAEIFWVVKHGIRMTGMPAFGPTHSDEDLWALTAFVRRLPDLAADDYAQMVADAGLEMAGTAGGHEHADGHGHGGSDEGGETTEEDDGHGHDDDHEHDHAGS